MAEIEVTCKPGTTEWKELQDEICDLVFAPGVNLSVPEVKFFFQHCRALMLPVGYTPRKKEGDL